MESRVEGEGKLRELAFDFRSVASRDTKGTGSDTKKEDIWLWHC
jgi:hypothetical protein